ncbi:hypothetical protein [Candidatus Poriferisodalis sp.]|uniref:hypothetical protein n=1 Tax=Candidatus Poriferisodalis sp. TaxID=3101277 RepID=UPI003B025FB2
MKTPRKRIAQVCSAAAGAAMLLPWHVNAGLGGNQTVLGIGITEGRLTIVACAVTIGLIHIDWRPAWIGAGFAAAIAAREIFDPSGIGPPGRPPDPGIGVWIAVVAAGIAAVLLVWDMLAHISGADDGNGPPKQGLSGPLGRRR